MSRPLLEGTVRRRLLALPGIEARENCVVDELAFSADGRRILGVLSRGETIAADLVVDTTGRGSHSAGWLELLGYPRPLEEKVEVMLAYTTRFFRRRESDLNGDVAVVIPSTPSGKRGGVMLAQEGGRWTVTLFGHFGHCAPADVPGFIEYARTIPASGIYDVIRDAEPLGEAALARFPASVRRRYERLARFPEGYLVFGDAICSFNPIYGQGMSVAALESVELDKALAEGSAGLSRRFFAKAAKVVDIPWSIAVGADLRMPEAAGPRPAKLNFINWYMSKLNRAGQRDPVLALAFHRVANLIAAPDSVMHPRMVWRVIRGSLGSTAQVGRRYAAESGLPPR